MPGDARVRSKNLAGPVAARNNYLINSGPVLLPAGSVDSIYYRCGVDTASAVKSSLVAGVGTADTTVPKGRI
jgi:hypothetical protein